jgi:hypothetical protein
MEFSMPNRASLSPRHSFARILSSRSGSFENPLPIELNRAQDVVQALLGIWLSVSPWLFDFAAHRSARWATLIIGLTVLLLAIEDRLWPSRVGEWSLLILGLVLLSCPWVFADRWPPVAAGNAVVFGAALVGFSGWAIARMHDQSVQGYPGGP